MKSTGIVRRLDDLGRVVLPKELRRTLNLREADPMEIYVHEDMIVLKKYRPTEEISSDVLLSALRHAAKETGCPPEDYIRAARADRRGGKG